MVLITVFTGAGIAVSLFSFTESILSFGILQFAFGFFIAGVIISNWIGIKTTFLYTGIFLIIVGVANWYKYSRKGDKSLSRGLLLTDKPV